jgi:acyl-CoA thioesterase-1
MKTSTALMFPLLLVLAESGSAGELKLASSGAREAVVELSGGQARLTLVKAWGRTRDPKPDGTAWKAEGDKLPAVVAKVGDDWVELSIPLKIEKDEKARIYRFDLSLPEAAGWADGDGARTCLRRGPKWQSVAELLAKQQPLPARWAWPAAPGLNRLYGKTGYHQAMNYQDEWTGFQDEFFKGHPDPLNTVDVGAIARTDGAGRTLALVAEQAIAVGWEGSKLSLCVVLRNGRAGQEVPVRLRLYCAQGQVPQLADKWAAELDRVPLRAVFMGDSVGAESGSYADNLAGRLVAEFPGRVRTLNASIGGSTTASALARYQGDALDYGTNLVVIQLCYNDVLKIKPEEVAANTRKMIDPVLANPGGRAVVLTPLSYDKKRVDDTLAKGTDINKVHSEQYIPALKKLVADYEADPKTKGRVAFVNIWEAMAKVRAEKGADYVLLPDGSHPNAEGHKLLADTVWPELRRLAEAALKEMEEKR